jgi:hypothetical protein
MPPRSTLSPLEKMTRKFKWAFAQYMEVEREWNRSAYTQYQTIRRSADDKTIPQHIKDEFVEMAASLKKQWECPICLEFIQPDTLEITPCGHKYCKGCLTQLKAQPEPKCAVCRRELRV